METHWKPKYLLAPDFAFLSYLWGMETFVELFLGYYGGHSSYPTYEEWKPKSNSSVVKLLSRFLSYLWGMETLCNRNEETFFSLAFLSYLWGMETQIGWKGFLKGALVLIKPMRNGNFCSTKYAGTTYLPRSYPCLWGMETLFSLYDIIKISFLSYLWEWKPSKKYWSTIMKIVLILPMRNGNCFSQHRLPIQH